MERYQDYVIKNGQLIGKFEEMYQKFDDPWHQKDSVQSSYARHASILSINRLGIKSLIEVGCGLGAYTNYLYENLPNVKITGMDISETAIKKAQKQYPQIDFTVGTLLEISKSKNEYSAILLAEVMWYVLEDINEIVENLSCNYAGKFVLINQTFYKGEQQYGNNYFTNLDEMVNFLPWKNMQKIVIEREDIDSIETHSIFHIKEGAY